MKERETKVFTGGKQVEHKRINCQTVSVRCYGKEIKTSDVRVEDLLCGLFYPLDSYADQLARTGGDVEMDIHSVLEVLLSHVKNQMDEFIAALHEHLGGHVFFLETLPGETNIKEPGYTGDVAGILVEGCNKDVHNLVGTEKDGVL